MPTHEDARFNAIACFFLKTMGFISKLKVFFLRLE